MVQTCPGRSLRHPGSPGDSRWARWTPQNSDGVVRPRDSRLAFRPAAGDAGDEVQRGCGEKLEFRPLQRAQLRREDGIGEPLAQESYCGVVLGTGVARECDLQA